jgi:hypothetical protein
MEQTTAARPRAIRIPTWQEETLRRGRRSLEAGAAYFAVLATAGSILGLIREVSVEAGLDPMVGALAEASLLLLVMLLASAAMIRWFGVANRAGDRLMVGAVGMSLVMAAELAGGWLIRGWGFYETLVNLTTRPGQVFVALLIAIVLAPLLQPRSGRAGGQTSPRGGVPVDPDQSPSSATE